MVAVIVKGSFEMISGGIAKPASDAMPVSFADETLEIDGVASLRASRADQPETALLEATFDEPVERAVASLSPDLRACIELVDIGELDYAETAQTLNVPIGTVRSRLFRARQQLHRALYRYAQQRGLVGGKGG